MLHLCFSAVNCILSAAASFKIGLKGPEDSKRSAEERAAGSAVQDQLRRCSRFSSPRSVEVCAADSALRGILDFPVSTQKAQPLSRCQGTSSKPPPGCSTCQPPTLKQRAEGEAFSGFALPPANLPLSTWHLSCQGT